MEGLRRQEVHTSSPGVPDSPGNPRMPFMRVEGKKKQYSEKRRVRKREIIISPKNVPFTRTREKGKILHYRKRNNRHFNFYKNTIG